MNYIQIPISSRKTLLGKYTSRQNKLHLITGWKHFHHWYVEWKWAGDPYKSRMLFSFSPEDKWVEAKSFDEDILPTYNYGKESK
jgi:hypothetical protein